MTLHGATDRAKAVALDVWIALDDRDCFLAKERITTAIAQFERPHEVTTRFRTVEFQPGQDSAPAVRPQASTGGQAKPTGTRDAQRLVALAVVMGGPALVSALIERLFVAQFQEQTAIDDPGTLLRLAAEAGLDETWVAAVLAGSSHTDAVRADQAAAAEQGIDTVPCVVADGGAVLAGLATVEEYLSLLRAAAGLSDAD